jgi:hypothetical protein
VHPSTRFVLVDLGCNGEHSRMLAAIARTGADSQSFRIAYRRLGAGTRVRVRSIERPTNKRLPIAARLNASSRSGNHEEGGLLRIRPVRPV